MVVLYNTLAPTVHGNAVPVVQMSTSLRIQNTSIQKPNIPKVQKSKNPKIQNFLHLRNLVCFFVFGFLGLGFLDFLCFTLVFPICRNNSKIGFGKMAFVRFFTVF